MKAAIAAARHARSKRTANRTTRRRCSETLGFDCGRRRRHLIGAGFVGNADTKLATAVGSRPTSRA
jgi:hypothetical protein